MPGLLPDNERLFELLTTCDSQLRAGFGGAYALDWGVVTRMADEMGIETDREFYQLLKAFESTMLGAIRKKQPKTADSDKTSSGRQNGRKSRS
jgi:hypothetical protein